MNGGQIIQHLLSNGYELQERTIYEKPRFVKEQNEVIVCIPCGWIKVNGQIKMLKSGADLKNAIDSIPI